MDPEEIPLANDTIQSDADVLTTPEAETVQVWQSDDGRYWDNDGNELEMEEDTPEPEPAAVVAAPVPVVEAEPDKPAYKPVAPSYNVPGMADADRERINEMALAGDFVGAQMELNRFVAMQERQSEAVANYHLDVQEQQYPDFFRTHRRTIQSFLAQAPPEMRAQENTVFDAALATLRLEIQQTKDFAGTIIRAAEMLSPKSAKPAPKPAPEPIRALPASQRVTTPTTAPSTATRPQTRGVSGDVKLYMEMFPGIDVDAAQRAVSLQKRRSG